MGQDSTEDLGAQLYWWGRFTSLWAQIACVRFSRSHGRHCYCSVCMQATRLGAYDVPAVGDKYIATGPGECFETGKVYTVVAVYDGRMDLECTALDTTVAGVQIDDPSLQPYTGGR